MLDKNLSFIIRESGSRLNKIRFIMVMRKWARIIDDWLNNICRKIHLGNNHQLICS